MDPLAPLAPALVLSTTGALIASALVVLAVILLWKITKLAVRVALIVAGAVAIFYMAQWAGWV